jgi:hypothetical protein
MTAPSAEAINHHVIQGKKGDQEAREEHLPWLAAHGLDNQGNPIHVDDAPGTAPDVVTIVTTSPDVDPIGDFLRKVGGTVTLTAIVPDGKITTKAFKGAGNIVTDWVTEHNKAAGIYWQPNPSRELKDKKSKKEHIAEVWFLHVDVDCRVGEDQAEGIARILKLGKEYPVPPTITTVSGGGVQFLWRLREPFKITDAASIDKIEGYNKQKIREFGGDTGTGNIDRILRLPGTMNWPNSSKVAKGRKPAPAYNVEFNDHAYGLDSFATIVVEAPKENEFKAEPKVEAGPAFTALNDTRLASIDPIVLHLIEHAKMPADAPDDIKHMKGGATHIKCVGELVRAGLTDDQIIQVYRLGKIAADAALSPRGFDGYMVKTIKAARKGTAPAKRIARLLNWREQTAEGAPIKSMHNAILAMNAIGIDCSYDKFHNKLLVGFKGDDVQHEITAVLGEVTDPTIIRLRKIMSDRFGFDLEDKATRDAINSEAFDHCFNPMADMLDKAEALWIADGSKPRLDRFGPEYLNTEDTPLNRATCKLHMIAGIRRVRWPGCKKDEILVLESDEGWNKSSAIRILAGDENFSDEKVFGLRGREVQEQLSEIWFHESADLGGLSKAHVDDVKAFASRQVDIARAAFGHFLTKQSRHSIEWGTTNRSEYLQSQEGNRRFWVNRVLKMIDLEKLKADRMMLLGEAANCETRGVSHVLDKALWPDAAEAQEERRVKDPWEDILEHLPKAIVHIEGGEERVSSSDLLRVVIDLKVSDQTPAHAMRLAGAMRRAGWQRHPNGYVTIGKVRQKGFFRWVALL